MQVDYIKDELEKLHKDSVGLAKGQTESDQTYEAN